MNVWPCHKVKNCSPLASLLCFYDSRTLADCGAKHNYRFPGDPGFRVLLASEKL